MEMLKQQGQKCERPKNVKSTALDNNDWKVITFNKIFKLQIYSVDNVNGTTQVKKMKLQIMHFLF